MTNDSASDAQRARKMGVCSGQQRANSLFRATGVNGGCVCGAGQAWAKAKPPASGLKKTDERKRRRLKKWPSAGYRRNIVAVMAMASFSGENGVKAEAAAYNRKLK